VDDLVCLYRAAGLGTPPLEVLRALAVGWSDGQAAVEVSTGVTDPETALPTRAYLNQRLVELYGRAARRGSDVPTTYALTAIDVAVEDVPRLLRSARAAAVGAGLREAFGVGHPMATLGGGIAVVLDRARPAADDAQTARLRAAIRRRIDPLALEDATRCPVRVWQVPLPDTPEAAAALLVRLSRPE
jgi:hypothetical protein